MKRKMLLVVALMCSAWALGAAQPSRCEEYKLREAAQYLKDRDGAEIPHTATSEHFAIKWGNENKSDYKIDDEFIKNALAYFEQVRIVFKDQVGWPYFKSEAGKYKVNIYITGTGLKPFLEGYAFGFPDTEGYGVFCAAASTMVPGHGASAHELGHAAEGETGNFRDSDYVGFFWECCAQFMAQQVNPTKNLPESLDLYCDMARFDWATAVNWHQYANWLLMQYFAEKPGFGYKSVVNLWTTKAIYQDEDPVSKMMRIQPFTKTQWSDMFGDYAKRNVNFASYKYGKEYKESLQKVEKRNEKAMARWKQALEPIKGKPNWYAIPYAGAPLQMGYNVIPLTPTSGAVAIDFKGLVDEERKSDWRATIVVVNDKGEERYSKSVGKGVASVKLSANEKEVYLVVSATPQVFKHIGFLEDYRKQDRFPYEVKIIGADPKGKDVDKVTPPAGVKGAAHANGGGFVAETAKVAPTAYVGPRAMVLDTAQVSENARIEGYAVISGGATVSGKAIVSGYAYVTGTPTISGNARVRDYSRVYDSAKIDGNARVWEYARIQGKTHIYDNAIARGSCTIGDGTVHGSACFTGASNTNGDIKDCIKGIFTGYVYPPDPDKGEDFDGVLARYDFDKPNNLLLRDSFATGDGIIRGKPVWLKDTERVQGLSFNGKNQYVEMPRNLSDIRDADISVWVKWNGGRAGQKIFDFGRDKANCMYLTPKDEFSKAAFVIIRDNKREFLQAAESLPVDKWCKVSITLSGGAVTMTVSDATTGPLNLTVTPEDLRADSNYLARGQEGGFFKGELDDFRINIRDPYEIVEAPAAPAAK
ncbi:MAG: DUF6055 domain-containing protein [Armatimonadetes bacterium]|nr:DUF6055 domain-containing protein [Armatimonadota bacterium]